MANWSTSSMPGATSPSRTRLHQFPRANPADTPRKHVVAQQLRYPDAGPLGSVDSAHPVQQPPIQSTNRQTQHHARSRYEKVAYSIHRPFSVRHTRKDLASRDGPLDDPPAADSMYVASRFGCVATCCCHSVDIHGGKGWTPGNREGLRIPFHARVTASAPAHWERPCGCPALEQVRGIVHTCIRAYTHSTQIHTYLHTYLLSCLHECV